MAKVLQHKVVSALPAPLEANSIYFVRVGTGFDIHVTNSSGTIVAYPINREPLIAAGTADQFYRGDKTWQDLASAVRAASLPGLSTANSSAVVASDTLLVGVGKLQAQVNNRLPLSGGKLSGALGREYVAGTSGLQRFQDLAAYTSNASSVTGTIKVTLPFSWTSTMMNVRIAGFNYVNGASWEILVGGYNPAASSNWTRVTASVVAGRPPFSQVRLAHDGTNCCILLGDTATAHAYPKVVVKEFIGGYQGMLNDWANGWTVGVITDETGVTTTQTVTGLTGTTAQYRRGDDTWQDLATAVRATVLTGLSIVTGAAIVAGDQLLVALGKLQGQINTLNAGKEDLIGLGTSAQYWRGDKAWRDFFTDVRAATLTGLTLANTAAVVATDTVLTGLGKLQAQVNGKAASGNNSDITNLNTLATATWATSGRILGDFGNNTIANRVYLQSSTANSNTLVGAIPSGSATISGFIAANNSAPTNAGYLAIICSQSVAQLDAGRFGTGTYQPLSVVVGGAERIGVSTNGDVKFNTSSTDPISPQLSALAWGPASGLYVSKNLASSGNGIAPLSLGVTGIGTLAQFYVNAGVAIGNISTNGTTTSYNTSSDYRLKDQVEDLDEDEAEARILAFRPVTWTWRIDGSAGKGFIAHEVQAVDESTATGAKDAIRRVGSITLVDGTVAAQGVEEPLDSSSFGEGAEWTFTEEQPVYQGRDDSKMIPDMIAMLHKLRRELDEAQTEIANLKRA